MDLVKVGTFTTTASVTGNLDVTNVGFEPSAIFVFMLNLTGTDAIAHAHGVGDASLNQWGVSAVATARASQGRTMSKTNIIERTGASSGSLVASAALTAMLSNGFRLNVTASTSTINWGYVAFHKNVQAKVGFITPPGTGANSITGVGFKPNGMITSWLTSTTGSTAASIGFVGTDLSQFGYSGGNNTGATSYNIQTTTDALMVASTGLAGQGAITSWNADGFTYNFSVTGGQEHGYLVFGGGLTAKVGSFTSPSSGTGGVSGLGFDPQGMITFPNINGVTTYGIPIGLGVADHNLNQALTATGGFSGATNNTVRYSATDRALGRTGYGTGAAPSYAAELTSVGSGSFTYTYREGGGGETYAYFAFGWNYTDRTQTGKARIGAITDRTQTGKTRIGAITSRTIQGLARIGAITSRTITGKTRIQKETSQDQTGIVSILSNVTRTQTGIASIAIDTFKTITGITRIGTITSRTQTGKTRIQTDTSRNQTGVVRIYQITSRLMTGIVRISTIATQTITGKTRIGDNPLRHQTGLVRIYNRWVFAGIYKPGDVGSGDLSPTEQTTGIIKQDGIFKGSLEQSTTNQGLYKPKDVDTGQLK